MAKFVLAYRGGGGMAATDEERAKIMAAWGQWMGQLGPALTDGGNPFAASATIAANGSVASGGSAGITGYSILSADNLDAAVASAKGCPVLAAGGSVDVYEAINVM